MQTSDRNWDQGLGIYATWWSEYGGDSASRYCLDRGATFKGMVVAEELHGRTHRLKLLATEIVPNRLLRYSSRGLRGTFVLEEANGGTRFTATLSFGVAAPWIGRITDRILGRVFANRLAAVQEHMREEGRNLKHLLERGAV